MLVRGVVPTVLVAFVRRQLFVFEEHHRADWSAGVCPPHRHCSNSLAMLSRGAQVDILKGQRG